jgi:cobalt/nickel transport system permease protein
MRSPELERYAELNSPVHNWDPRVKIISCIIFLCTIAATGKPSSALAALVATGVLVIISRIPLGFVLGQVKYVIYFLLPLCVIILFSYQEGPVLAKVAFLTVTEGGYKKAALLFLRPLAMVLLIFPMLGTMRFDQAINAMESIKVPSNLLQVFAFTYRYIFVLIDEIRRMQRAQAARCFQNKLSLSFLRTMGMFIGMIFIRAHERAERVIRAMLSRGYDGKTKVLHQFNIHPSDLAKALLLVSVGIAILLIP